MIAQGPGALCTPGEEGRKTKKVKQKLVHESFCRKLSGPKEALVGETTGPTLLTGCVLPMSYVGTQSMVSREWGPSDDLVKRTEPWRTG